MMEAVQSSDKLLLIYGSTIQDVSCRETPLFEFRTASPYGRHTTNISEEPAAYNRTALRHISMHQNLQFM
jgi:hypothetical protein